MSNENIENVVENVSENTTTESKPVNTSEILDVNSALTSVIARNEATQLIVAVLNAFLNCRQAKEDSKLPDDEIAAIQNTINIETDKTSTLFNSVEAYLKEHKAIVDASPSGNSSSIADSDIIY